MVEHGSIEGPSKRPSRPYPGLRPFNKDEASIFFGRESMTRDVVRRLLRKHVVAVHGDSGSGKSSLILAGVLPWLESEIERTGGRWRTCSMRPSGSPLANLVTALAGITGADRRVEFARVLTLGESAPACLAGMLKCNDADNICILFDQFEELFEHAKEDNGTEARLVTSFLVGLASNPPKGLHAILTMRSDYLGRCAQYEGFAEIVNETQYLVPRMERPALLRAIGEPAKLYGGSVAPELADRLIADAGEGQDQLPLIQHGLMRLWQEKIGQGGGRDLGLGDLGEERTLSELLSEHADDVMKVAVAANPKEDTRIVESVFRALSERTPEGAEIRRSRTFKELCDITGAAPGRLRAILAPFRAEEASFLRPHGAKPLEDGDPVDVSHEAFIRNWRKFQNSETGDQKGWLDKEAEDRLQWSSLSLQAKSRFGILFPTAAVGAWRWLARKNANWAGRYGGDFGAVRRFVRKSLIAGGVMALSVIVFWAVLLFLYGEAQKRTAQAIKSTELAMLKTIEAELLSDKAMKNETIALASLSRVALQEGLPVESVKLALAAWPRDEKTQRPKLRRTVDILGEALPKVYERLRQEGHTSSVSAVAFSPDGRRILTGSYDNTARLWDAASGALLKTLEGHTNRITAVAFSPDGRRILTGSWDNTARLWDAGSGAPLKTLEGHTDSVTAVAFSPDGRRILTGSGDNTARLWDISDLEKGDAFHVACQRLRKISEKSGWNLNYVQNRYGLDPLPPICGEHAPSPADLRELQ